MQPQAWRLQAAVAVLILVVEDVTRMRTNLNGHAAVQEWQTVCASAKRNFIDKRIIKKQKSWELENQKSLHQ